MFLVHFEIIVNFDLPLYSHVSALFLITHRSCYSCLCEIVSHLLLNNACVLCMLIVQFVSRCVHLL